MAWWIRDGEELANLIYSTLKESENGELTFFQVLDIIDSKTYFGFNQTMGHSHKILSGMKDVEILSKNTYKSKLPFIRLL